MMLSLHLFATKEYNIGIRAHWAVESMHYVKDVTYGEDVSFIRASNASTNFPQAIRMLGGKVKKLYFL